VEAPDDFIPLLKAAIPGIQTWDRIILVQQASGILPSTSAVQTRDPYLSELPKEENPDRLSVVGRPQSDFHLRRLSISDAHHLWGLSPEVDWISKTWGGPPGLATSGCAWGAFVEGKLASVACTFFYGETYEDIGIVTEPEYRGLGLSEACAGLLCADIRERGRRPSWTTSPDNTASLRVAEKLGFVPQRSDRLFVAGVSIPVSARKPPTRTNV
jgi:RimJ/RimL family protein N-acetyltransferase